MIQKFFGSKSFFSKSSSIDFEEPIRSEIFGLARFETHAQSLALAQKVTNRGDLGRDFAPRTSENGEILEDAYLTVIQAIEDHRAITPAAEWLVDNFHIVRTLLKDIHDFLPPQYYRQLPKLSEGHLAGYPRVYGITYAFVAHTDSRFDPDLLKSFLVAYQKIQPLTIGELWAVSITLRIVLIENLRRLAVRMVGSQLARKNADQIADEVLGLGELEGRSVKNIVNELEGGSFSGPFFVQLLKRLRFQEIMADPVLNWLDRRLTKDHLIADEVVSTEHSSQTAMNATVRNIITSSRLIAVFDWKVFFEEISNVDKILEECPNYKLMDFSSRDRYRQALEELASRSDYSELEVARKLVDKTKQGAHQVKLQSNILKSERSLDPGYYLISSGRREFESELDFRLSFRGKLNRAIGKHDSLTYILAILLLTFCLAALPLDYAIRNSEGLNRDFILLILFFGLFPASEIAIEIVNRMIIFLIGPRYLPRLNFKECIPEKCKTFVVVPTMFGPVSRVAEQIDQLEIHYLANTSENIYYALLTDWGDSELEVRPEDLLVLDEAIKSLDLLNAKYGQTGSGEDRFYIFHRKRIYNPKEGKWIGWERKRGKLHEFNRLLLGNWDTTHIPLKDRSIFVPSGIKYIITLDADTKLPMGAAAQLIGTIAHPLNSAWFDMEKMRVTEGFGILQPRVTAALPSIQESTFFQRISAGPAGIDPYASAVSDVYQDLFGEGSYMGKGIYDLAIFEQALKNRVPENSLLSHDLFEGNFARCGFVSDIEFFEDFPSHSGIAALRTHRWIRGDWQLLPWIIGPKGRAISLIGRWKMLDNLRRSLIAPMTFLTLVTPFVIPGTTTFAWWVLALTGLSIPPLVSLIPDIFVIPRSVSFFQHLKFKLREFRLSFDRSLFCFAILPYQAWISIDAIIRALYRLLISHRHMLEWTTAARTKESASLRQSDFWMSMKGGLGLSLVGLAGALTFNQPTHVGFLVMILFWGISPVIARIGSSPPRPLVLAPASLENILLLKLTGRRIWHFFTQFVTDEDHHLPPDNFQEDPKPVLAHRSSPTNFGLYLLSIVSAHDFGWIGLHEMSERLEVSLQSLKELPKHKGHFFNWYDTRSQRPLHPQYISSVDNGNLAGHLLVIGQVCCEKLNGSVISSSFAIDIFESYLLLKKSLLVILEENNEISIEVRKLANLFEDLQIAFFGYSETFQSRAEVWNALRARSKSICQAATELETSRFSQELSEVVIWSYALNADIESSARDFFALMEWSDFVGIDIEVELPLDLTISCRQGITEMWNEIKIQLIKSVVLKDLEAHCFGLSGKVNLFCKNVEVICPSLDLSFGNSLRDALERSANSAKMLVEKFQLIQRLCQSLFQEMNFGLLYSPVRKLFSIGLRVEDNTLDPGFYDLLASEARLTSFVAIAKGEVPVDHWFSMSRTLTPVEGGAALVSWSGSMFEYLMPTLVMNSPVGSLLDQTCELIIRRQISYGIAKNVVWGISESAYNKRDLHLTYQYSNFGIPDLGLKRGLGNDLVISPYASFLAAMTQLAPAAENLRRLEVEGALGTYGFYEAVDYTASRLQEGQQSAVVKAYMAHHQGMSLVSLCNIFKQGIMRKRFHLEPLIQATDLLLQERAPRHISTIKQNVESYTIDIVNEIGENISRKYHSVNRPVPTTNIISNGNYSVMLTSAGSGFSRFQDIAITRWREDVTRDQWGSYFYLKDLASGKVWSPTFQPTCVEADQYEVDFSDEKASFLRTDFGITCHLEILVSAEDNAEVRQMTLKNSNIFTREIEITSYSEIVINSQAADIAHSAFSNLFVETEHVNKFNALFATRRPRSSNEIPLWTAQVLLPGDHSFGEVEYETDRYRFIGRGQSPRDPMAVGNGVGKVEKLSNSVGPVLDPIFSLRTRIRLPPGESARVIFTTVVTSSRESLELLAEKFSEKATFDRIENVVWTTARVKLNHLNIDQNEANHFQRLATRLLYSDSSLRPSAEILKRNNKNLSDLWSHGISGDFPIILIRIDDFEDRSIVRQLLKAQEYLATKRFVTDLVIINEKATSYVQDLQLNLEAMVHSSAATANSLLPQTRGKVFVLRADILSKSDLDLLYSEARAVLSSRLGNLAEQVERIRFSRSKVNWYRTDSFYLARENITSLEIPKLVFFNGIGGFTSDGHEYVIVLKNRDQTPSPWINVIANPEFGFQVSESGSGFTWSKNSRENQLTPWTNDPVCDPSGESFYILDRISGQVWSPTAQPIRVNKSVYITRHGQGYSKFEHLCYEVSTQLTQFVAWDEPIKVSHLKIENKSKKIKSLSIAGYVEWVLGFSRATMAASTVTEFDKMSGLIFAYNTRNIEFGERIAFAGFVYGSTSYTGDRSEFIGRNGSLNAPSGIFQEKSLSGHVGAGFDPCAALLIEVELKPGESIELSFVLGQANDRNHAREIIQRYKSAGPKKWLQHVISKWNEILGKVRIETPDLAFNFLINRWLLYQTLACRMWARSAFYQAGGAFGFRDQLQDVMALTLSLPNLAKQHILRAAGRQFFEGDVQHWWHPPSGRGVRTHFSDDLLWLPFAVAHYIQVTSDFSILESEVAFIEGPLLRPDQEDSYFVPTQSHRAASIFEHCAQALDRSLKVGLRGLPLMGGGDWNDGMNRVGKDHLGESVWLAWFLSANLSAFAPFAERFGQQERARTWLRHVTDLSAAAESNAWDGEWYRRAYFDDGTPLGSSLNEECQIDSLAQSWSVISQTADPKRARLAMASVEKFLIKEKDQMILLFTPAFNKSSVDPGYIKGYLPGIRENGGQYTHAAAWCVIAFAMLNEGQRAGELFSLLNPIVRTQTRENLERYKLEPYVVAGDIYSEPPHTGRGGWSWYTGSAGWMYRAGLEYILGFSISGDILTFNPKIQSEWKSFKIFYLNGTSQYTIEFQNAFGIVSPLTLLHDGIFIQQVNEASIKIKLQNDGQPHQVSLSPI